MHTRLTFPWRVRVEESGEINDVKLYYLLQCIVAIIVSKSTIQRAGIALVAVALGFITLFAVPAG